jgi:hypothetical protein
LALTDWSGRCTPGKVTGGSFATSAGTLSQIAAGGSAPRTSYADRGRPPQSASASRAM